MARPFGYLTVTEMNCTLWEGTYRELVIDLLKLQELKDWHASCSYISRGTRNQADRKAACSTSNIQDAPSE